MSILTPVLPQITSPPQALAEVVLNTDLIATQHQAVYAIDDVATSGLNLWLVAGRWGGFAYTPAALTLTASATNYVVVAVATGVPSVSTATTNWNDAANYVRAFNLTTSATAITASEDHRAGPRGVHGGAAGSSSSGVSLATVNAWTKNQSVVPVALTDGSSIATDASLSNNFTVTLGGNRTLANPTNLTAGMWLHFVVKQDGTGTRTLGYGSAFKWPGGTVPVLSAAAGEVDTISGYSDGTTIYASAQKGFA